MDVLQYWEPTIDWTKFAQGGVSDGMWSRFQQLVRLCHSYRHWKATTRDVRLSPVARSIYGSESKYMRAKRRRERDLEIKAPENHMYRAAFLASEKIAEMSFLVSPADKGRPDHTLYIALLLSVAHLPNHERAKCEAAAFDEFNALTELQGAPEDIAKRWCKNAGMEETL